MSPALIPVESSSALLLLSVLPLWEKTHSDADQERWELFEKPSQINSPFPYTEEEQTMVSKDGSVL